VAQKAMSRTRRTTCMFTCIRAASVVFIIKPQCIFASSKFEPVRYMYMSANAPSQKSNKCCSNSCVAIQCTLYSRPSFEFQMQVASSASPVKIN
jgi:hypothetical protein